jgi:hypothetical protein
MGKNIVMGSRGRPPNIGNRNAAELLASARVRAITGPDAQLMRAYVLHREYGVSLDAAVAATGASSKGALLRFMHALDARRPPHRIGRPPHLSAAVERLLVRTCIEAYESLNSLTMNDVLTEVCELEMRMHPQACDRL